MTKTKPITIEAKEKFKKTYIERKILFGAITWDEIQKVESMGIDIFIETHKTVDNIYLNGKKYKLDTNKQTTIENKLNLLNKISKYNWEIRFHSGLVDINYPDSPVTPDYEDYKTLGEVLDAVLEDLKLKTKLT